MSNYKLIYILSVNYTEGKGAMFLTKEESRQVLGCSHIALSEIGEGVEWAEEDAKRGYSRVFHDNIRLTSM